MVYIEGTKKGNYAPYSRHTAPNVKVLRKRRTYLNETIIAGVSFMKVINVITAITITNSVSLIPQSTWHAPL